MSKYFYSGESKLDRIYDRVAPIALGILVTAATLLLVFTLVVFALTLGGVL